MKLSEYTKHIKGDLFGGMTAAIVALPMGLAFGIQSGLGAEAGLYTGTILAVVAAIFGGTKTLITDPTGPMTVVAAGIISSSILESNNDVNVAMVKIVATFALAGIIQASFSFLKIARYVKYIPYPVVSGFMGGIGVIIIVLQVFPLVGHASPKGIINIFSEIGTPLSAINYSSLLIGLGTIAIIYILPRISKAIPSILVAIVAATVASSLMELEIPVIGEINTGIPHFHWEALLSFRLSHIGAIFAPAVTLASLGMIDTLLTSVVADNLTDTKHNGDRELLGQGVGNFVTAMFGGIPGAGATMGTVINIKSGAKTNLSGIFKGVFLFVVIIGLGAYVKYIPMAALAGILFTIGVGIIDLKGLRLLLKVPRIEAAILILTLLVTVFDSLLNAVALGAILSTVAFMKKMSDVMGNMNTTSDIEDYTKLAKKIPEQLKRNIHVKELDGPLFFGFADQFREQSKTITNMYAVIILMKKVPFIDETGLITLEETIKDFRKRDIDVYIVGANEAIYEQFEKVKIPGHLIHEDHFFPSFNFCVKYLKYKFMEGDFGEEGKVD